MMAQHALAMRAAVRDALRVTDYEADDANVIAAFHEIGHLITGKSGGSRAISVQIDRRGGGLCRMYGGPTCCKRGIVAAIFALGGIAAEGFFFGVGTDPRSFAVTGDMQAASVAVGASWDYGPWNAADQWTTLMTLQSPAMQYAFRRATAIVEQNESVVIALASALLRQGRLGAAQIYDIIDAHGGIARIDLAA